METSTLMEWLLSLGSISIALLVSVIGGFVSALWQYNKERRNIPPTFDVIDFLIILVTSPFAGIVLFLSGSLITENIEVLYSIAAIGAVGGLGTLIAIKDGLMQVIHDHVRSLAPKGKENDKA